MTRPLVLLVDDTREQLELYEMALSERYRTLSTTRSEIAYDLAISDHPDVVVADILMPGLDGWGLCQRLKATPMAARIPIVLLTAAEDADLLAHGHRVGAAAVLHKPCSLADLSEMIDRVLASQPIIHLATDRDRPRAGDFGETEDRAVDGPAPGPHASSPDRSAPGRIVVVDDERLNLQVLTRLLTRDGHDVRTAMNGEEALEMITQEPPDLVLMDVLMPKRDGFETCRALKQQAATRLIPVVLVTALQGPHDKLLGLEAGADDFLTKPVHAPELRARVRSLLRLKRATDDLESADAVMLALGETIEARNPYTQGHCQRLATYAVALGEAVGVDRDVLPVLEHGGFLHDIGKVGIPDAVLLKPSGLTAQEYALVKQHPLIGDHLCDGLRSLGRARGIVRHHHERLDGSGYPDGLRGDAIPFLAQIMSVVDVYDALTTTRPYKTAVDPACASEELRGEAKRGWLRTDLVEAFIQVQGARSSAT